MDAFVEFLAFLVPSHVCHHHTFLALSQSGSPTETDRQKPSLHFPVKTVLRSLHFLISLSTVFRPTDRGGVRALHTELRFHQREDHGEKNNFVCSKREFTIFSNYASAVEIPLSLHLKHAETGGPPKIPRFPFKATQYLRHARMA